MSGQSDLNDINVTNRAFTLLHKLSKDGKLTPEEVHELLQTQKKMASSELLPQLQSGLESLGNRIDIQNSKIDAQTSKYNLLLWFIGVGVGLIIASNFVN